MTPSRFSDEQFIGVLKDPPAGATADLWVEHHPP